jgi:hypothetical protein
MVHLGIASNHLDRATLEILDGLSNWLTRRLKEAHAMAFCEYRLEPFYARGDDEYLDGFAQHLDELFAEGWILVDSTKDKSLAGWWRVELFKEMNRGGRHNEALA